jgi:hypothetical protein
VRPRGRDGVRELDGARIGTKARRGPTDNSRGCHPRDQRRGRSLKSTGPLPISVRMRTATRGALELRSEGGTAPRRVRHVLSAFVLVFAVYVSCGVSDFSDSLLSVPTAHSLLHDGDLDLSEFSDHPGLDAHYGMQDLGGRRVDYFPWLTAVFAVPVVALWDLLASAGITTSSEELIGTTGVRTLQVVAGSTWAAAAAVVLALVTDRLRRLAIADRGPGVRRGGLLPDLGDRAVPVHALVIGLGTALWSTASRGMWQHGPSILLCGLAVLFLLTSLDARSPRRGDALVVAAGVCAGLSYWVRPTNVVLLGVLVLWLALRRRRDLPALAVGVLAAMAVVVSLNLVLLGTVQPPYFQASRVGWHAALPEAVAANLVSPARGLFVFSPFLLAALALLGRERRSALGGELRAIVVSFLLGTVGYLVAVSAYGERWWAGESYGPRFMSESIVLLAPLALLVIFGPRPASARPRSRWVQGAVIASMVWSIVAHGQSALVTEVRCWNKEPVNVDLAPNRVWDLARPQVSEGVRLVATGALDDGPRRCEL